MKNSGFRLTTMSALIWAALGGGTARAAEWVCVPGNLIEWTIAANWLPAVVPATADSVLFRSPMVCRESTVDRDFTIASLTYGGNVADWATRLPGTTLSVGGPVAIGLGDPSQGAGVTWTGSGRVIVGTSLAPASVSIGVNNSAAGSGTTVGNLTLANDGGLGGFISELSIGTKAGFAFGQSYANNSDASLVLGSNSTLTVGTAAARANVYVGYNPQTLGSATGLLDARQGTVDIHANEFNLGYAGSTTGAATGTLRWNSPNTLDANAIYISRGMGSGILELAPGASFISRSSTLSLAYNDSGSSTGTTLANLVLTTNNPNFNAFVGSELSIGTKAGFAFGQSYASNSDASLVLGSNSTLTVGTAAARANVYVGYNPQTLGSATGLLDARQGTVDIHANEFNLGYAGSTTGAATGTLRWNSPNTLDANAIYISRGMGSGILELAPGASFISRSSTLSLAYNDSGSSTGTTLANLVLTTNNPNFNAFVGSELSIGTKAGFAFGQSYASNSDASLVLGSNSTLTVGTAAARANVYVGYNPQTLGSATGLLDARQGTVDIHANEFNLGYAGSTTGAATGTLRWNSPNTLDANAIYISRGMGSGILELAPGASFISRSSTLSLAYNDSGSSTGTTLANLVLTTNNPNFNAFVGSELSIGTKAGFAFGQSYASNSDASLVLGSNSTLTVGTAAARANVYVGYNPQTLGSATGLLDARQGTVDIHANEFNLGYAGSTTGAATGTLRWNSPNTLDANAIYISRGMGSGILELAPGASFISRSSTLSLAYNDSGSSTGTTLANLVLTTNNPNFNAFVGSELSIGTKAGFAFGQSYASNSDASLVLGSNSTLTVGTAAARANVYVGYNPQTLGSATGLLDARQGTVDIHANEFNLGYAGSTTGAATGTLRWNSPNTLDANAIYISRGMGSGILELAPGASFISRSSTLSLAYNDSGSSTGTTLANLVLTTNNPNFNAFVGSELSIGTKAGFAFGQSYASNSDASLVLGSNSTLTVGTAAARANVYVGYNPQTLGSATGLLDARQGTVDIHANEFNLGYAGSTTGAATGTMYTGARTLLDTTNLFVARGPGAKGDFHHTAGTVTARTTTLGTNGQFIFTGGRFNAITFNGALQQDGGVLAPGAGSGPSRLAISQGYRLASAGTLEIDIAGATAGTGYDQLAVLGAVDLNRDLGLGGALDLRLAFAAPVGSAYTIIDNDGTDAVAGRFKGLAEGASFAEQFDQSLYTYRISYLAGTGNDVVLNLTGVTPVPEPGTALLLAFGIGAMLAWRRSRQGSN